MTSRKEILKKTTLLLCCLFLAVNVRAQELHFADSANALNHLRIETNQRGMKVLTSWGIANMAGGALGYFTANSDEWQYFHEMNFLWGVVNTGIGIMGYLNTRQEMKKNLTCSQALKRYKSTKRLYLINAGLDVVYIGTGALCLNHANNHPSNPAMWTGFGRSLVLQGAFLLIFDNVMYLSHQSNNSKWSRLAGSVCITGNGIMVNYTF